MTTIIKRLETKNKAALKIQAVNRALATTNFDIKNSRSTLKAMN